MFPSRNIYPIDHSYSCSIQNHFTPYFFYFLNKRSFSLSFIVLPSCGHLKCPVEPSRLKPSGRQTDPVDLGPIVVSGESSCPGPIILQPNPVVKCPISSKSLPSTASILFLSCNSKSNKLLGNLNSIGIIYYQTSSMRQREREPSSLFFPFEQRPTAQLVLIDNRFLAKSKWTTGQRYWRRQEIDVSMTQWGAGSRFI